jgi:hypothetical protein
MKFALQIVFILVFAYVLELFFPWWTIAIAGFLGGVLFNSRSNFGAGFLAIALLWALKALLIEVTAAAPLSDRVAAIFSLDKPLLFVVTAIIGGLVGGFACMTGSALHKGKKRSSYY